MARKMKEERSVQDRLVSRLRLPFGPELRVIELIDLILFVKSTGSVQ
jgi:hypothetical protein